MKGGAGVASPGSRAADRRRAGRWGMHRAARVRTSFEDSSPFHHTTTEGPAHHPGVGIRPRTRPGPDEGPGPAAPFGLIPRDPRVGRDGRLSPHGGGSVGRGSAPASSRISCERNLYRRINHSAAAGLWITSRATDELQNTKRLTGRQPHPRAVHIPVHGVVDGPRADVDDRAGRGEGRRRDVDTRPIGARTIGELSTGLPPIRDGAGDARARGSGGVGDPRPSLPIRRPAPPCVLFFGPRDLRG